MIDYLYNILFLKFPIVEYIFILDIYLIAGAILSHILAKQQLPGDLHAGSPGVFSLAGTPQTFPGDHRCSNLPLLRRTGAGWE